MFRTIVTSLLMIEGGLFLASGLAPGVEEMVQATLSQHPDLVPPDQLGKVIAVFAWLQRIAMGFGLLCLLGGWGASQGTKWGRWTAVAASILNLLVFPIGTVLGVSGLILFVPSPPKPEGEGAAAPVKAEKPEPVSHVLVMIASLALVVYLSHGIRKFAASQGLPVDPEGRLDLYWILAGQLVFTLFHELGHLLAAWAVGFRFHEINVGPFTLSERPGGGWAFRFDYHRILMAGGYLQAIPTTTKDLRMNWILVVVAGPAASLFLAMVGFLGLLSLAGTPYAGYWEIAAFVTAICTADCIANLLPLGLTDGALLVHTALGTKRGKGILAGLEAAMLNDKADREGSVMDPAEVLEARRKALEQLEKSTEANGLALAAQRIEFASASRRNGQVEEAAAALQEAGKALMAIAGVPDQVWFRYWVDMYETATVRRQFTAAAGARDRALEYGDKLAGESMDWDAKVPIRLACARLSMSDADYITAVTGIQDVRKACPGRRAVSAFAAELLAVEGECELRLGRRGAAETLLQSAVEVAQALPDAQQTGALEALARSAAELSSAGDYDLAQPLFEAAVAGLEAKASAPVGAMYRAAWAESLYENGKLAEAKAVLAQLQSANLAFAMDVETLRAQLLLAEDRPREAVAVLSPMMEQLGGEATDARQVEMAQTLALRSWALYRCGETDGAVADARTACEALMPVEHPGAAPALLTLAMAIVDENADLAEAYVQEGSRLICDTTLYTPLAKASRLTDLARSVVQVSRKDWAKAYMEKASKFRGEQRRAHVPATTGTVASAK